MRDPKRIDRIMKQITDYWKENTDQRFFQMMINVGLVESDSNKWHIEDDVTEEHLQKRLSK